MHNWETHPIKRGSYMKMKGRGILSSLWDQSVSKERENQRETEGHKKIQSWAIHHTEGEREN